ncbi:hypothetical protein BCR42DRAFT_406485 [Absidia repens]|uniref:Chitin synthase export chaperone n=1 Tax=Absidia repens TaxID=90262 RepID=A0A1X2IUW5_9FUNG|nr:hypothetical protein BCR42DRAFT_406485 [Absidia repens]
MSPKGRGGGGVHIIGGGGDDSSVDPVTLSNYFSYATLGVYGLYFFYCIMVVLAQKAHFPYMYLYTIITLGLLSSILTVVSIQITGGSSPTSTASVVYYDLMLYLVWLFLFEPSRQINNLRQAPTSSSGRTSAFKFSQYTSSTVGIVILCGYLWAIILMILNIVMAIATYYVASPAFVGLYYFLIYAPWLFVLMWFFLAAKHWQYIGDKNSYGIYGFFALCMQVGGTVINSPGVIDDNYFALVIVRFVMIQCCHFIALYFGFIKGSLWVNSTRYNSIKN